MKDSSAHPSSIAWIHIGDLHMDEADGWAARPRLQAIVDELNAHARAADFVYLPGDNANHATPAQYAAITEALGPLALPWRVIPGDHDFEGGSLAAYEAAFAPAQRPEHEVIAGHRCIFVDVVGSGAGGPDFRLNSHHRHRIARQLALAEAAGEVPLVFMHCYPGDMAADGEALARLFADARVPFVDTGHTHYNELLNDGAVVYGATRSTAQIEEGGGTPGFSVVCVHDGVPSWRFRPLGACWPHVQIVAPCDLRLVTRASQARQVPRPGVVRVVARRFGAADAPMMAALDDAAPHPMRAGAPGFWEIDLPVDAPGLHRIDVSCGRAADSVEVLVRASDGVPRRGPLVAPGHACHAIGAWPVAGIDGLQLGPNRNGGDW
ncbi:MAG: metallophosphoesterase [Pseudacidovorax sp.]|uniref:metallophosphoesterase family protein n=1 Tax=Pseudacidovorax sp. TaxID=1934311 RepID=UPI001B490A3A|nr:metallophosphoesterase [Pseudacidovorax sp.]MBP6895458.1 metallophosphoesterase [Pseudacidovorax sp.]